MELRILIKGDGSMFCSQCGQQRASESVRFCSRCGFKLTNVEEPSGKRLIGMAMYLFLTVCAILGWASVTSGPNHMQVRILVTLIAAVTFYLLFSRDLRRIFDKLFSQHTEEIKQITHEAPPAPALPPAQSIPASILVAQRVNTAEMAQPPSVTEHTTISLEKKSL